MIRVLIVHEQHLMASLIAAVLADEDDIEVAGRASDASAALARAAEASVALVSTRLPDGSALALVRTLARQHPDLTVLAVGVAEAQWEIMQYVEAGASGYVLKDDNVAELLRHIRAAHAGKARVSPEIAAALMSRVAELARLVNQSSISADLIDLTPREIEVLELIGQDLTNQQIAERLVIELGTVKNHVHNILDKLGVSSRRDAAGYLAVVERQSRK